MEPMRFLIFNVPSRRGPSGKWIPIAAMAVGGIVERAGHTPRFIDLYDDNDDGTIDWPTIRTRIEDFNPNIIGFTGIATSYGLAKELSILIRNQYPEVILIAGGALASAYDLLLEHTGIDVVFHGEAETSLDQFLHRLEAKESVSDIKGISYLSSGEVIRNDPVVQIKDLDSIPFPAYHIVDNVERYFEDAAESFKSKFDIAPVIQGNRRHIANLLQKNRDKLHDITERQVRTVPIMTSRGCTHKCTFCYRHVNGMRNHSPEYVIRHIEFLRNTYGVEGVRFADELFTSRKKRVFEICEAVRDSGLDTIFDIQGVRCDKVDRELLELFWESGAWGLSYGQESGSEQILAEYAKGVTREQNIFVTKLTNEVGLANTVQLVFGSPSETVSTIYETISFLKESGAYGISLNYMIPLPETPMWKHCIDNGDIVDQEIWLELAAEFGGPNPLLNLTRESDIVWRYFAWIMVLELRMHYWWKTVKLVVLPKRLKNVRLQWLEDALFAIRRSIAIGISACMRAIRPPTRGPRFRPGARARVRHFLSNTELTTSGMERVYWRAREYPIREIIECQNESLVIDNGSAIGGGTIAVEIAPRSAPLSVSSG